MQATPLRDWNPPSARPVVASPCDLGNPFDSHPLAREHSTLGDSWPGSVLGAAAEAADAEA